MKKTFTYDKESLTFQDVEKPSYLKVTMGIVLAIIILFIVGHQKYTSKVSVKINDTLSNHEQKFSEEAVISLLRECNVKYPYIVLAQAKLESDNFKSKMFKENNNMFGMRKAKQRVTSSESEKKGYAYYRNWIDGVYDYCMWQQNMTYNVSNESEYFAKLEEKYAEDVNYVSKIKEIIKREKLKGIFAE